MHVRPHGQTGRSPTGSEPFSASCPTNGSPGIPRTNGRRKSERDRESEATSPTPSSRDQSAASGRGDSGHRVRSGGDPVAAPEAGLGRQERSGAGPSRALKTVLSPIRPLGRWTPADSRPRRTDIVRMAVNEGVRRGRGHRPAGRRRGRSPAPALYSFMSSRGLRPSQKVPRIPNRKTAMLDGHVGLRPPTPAKRGRLSRRVEASVIEAPVGIRSRSPQYFVLFREIPRDPACRVPGKRISSGIQ